MKRAITALGALAIAAGFFLTAPATQASHPNTPGIPPVSIGCSLVNDQTLWPRNGHYYYCGTNTALYRNPSASTVTNLPPLVRQKLIDNKTWLLITDTPAEANSYLGTSVPASGILGNTVRVNFFGTTYVFISSWETVPSADMEEVLIHEQGHALDYAWGTTIGSPSGVSQGVGVFWTKVGQDWTDINALSEAVVFPRGIPNKKINMPGGTWTSYTPPAVGTPNRNEIILKDLFPWIFGNTSAAKAELWAHLYVKFRNKFLNDNPYAAVPQAGGSTTNYLTWPETFTHFKKTAQTNSTSYFGVMWYNTASFIP